MLREGGVENRRKDIARKGRKNLFFDPSNCIFLSGGSCSIDTSSRRASSLSRVNRVMDVDLFPIPTTIHKGYILFREAGEEEWRGMLSARSRGRARFLPCSSWMGRKERSGTNKSNRWPILLLMKSFLRIQDSSRIGGIHAKGGNRMEKLSFWTILPGYSR